MSDTTLVERLINAVADHIQGMTTWAPGGHARASRKISDALAAERVRVAQRCAAAICLACAKQEAYRDGKHFYGDGSYLADCAAEAIRREFGITE